MAENKAIVIKGARVNNLKNIDVVIPRGKFVVITGLSGSLSLPASLVQGSLHWLLIPSMQKGSDAM